MGFLTKAECLALTGGVFIPCAFIEHYEHTTYIADSWREFDKSSNNKGENYCLGWTVDLNVVATSQQISSTALPFNCSRHNWMSASHICPGCQYDAQNQGLPQWPQVTQPQGFSSRYCGGNLCLNQGSMSCPGCTRPPQGLRGTSITQAFIDEVPASEETVSETQEGAECTRTTCPDLFNGHSKPCKYAE